MSVAPCVVVATRRSLIANEGGRRKLANVSNGDKSLVYNFALSWLLILPLARDESGRRAGRVPRFASV